MHYNRTNYHSFATQHRMPNILNMDMDTHNVRYHKKPCVCSKHTEGISYMRHIKLVYLPQLQPVFSLRDHTYFLQELSPCLDYLHTASTLS